ncbi:hypothetical protein M9H77_15390 [Catharanthus roseus]|uniref:Uncharacterized protein n=1 Tax=Catharanthus roseus TaxID=4058 RepID=A0ACC0AZY2_CATRO|nr:hypothetical protein M9H77_15390 [Catharanthus roseus]
MASVSARRLVQRSTSYAKNAFMSSTLGSTSSKLGGLAPTIPSPAPRISRRQNLFFSIRLPKELSCGDSLMPLHSVTASVLLKSLLSSEVGQWGSLSEGTNQRLEVLCKSLITILLNLSTFINRKFEFLLMQWPKWICNATIAGPFGFLSLQSQGRWSCKLSSLLLF